MKSYPDNGLSEPVRDLSECFSGIEMLREEMEKKMRVQTPTIFFKEDNKDDE